MVLGGRKYTIKLQVQYPFARTRQTLRFFFYFSYCRELLSTTSAAYWSFWLYPDIARCFQSAAAPLYRRKRCMRGQFYSGKIAPGSGGTDRLLYQYAGAARSADRMSSHLAANFSDR